MGLAYYVIVNSKEKRGFSMGIDIKSVFNPPEKEKQDKEAKEKDNK